MVRSLGLLCVAVLLSALFGVATATTVDAAFVYDVAVVGDGVDGHGSISLPTDTGTIVLPTDVSATGFALDLDVMLFGNHVVFTEDDLVGGPLTWTGADPTTAPPLTFVGLSLTATSSNGQITFVLSDDAGGVGSAICNHPVGGMNGCRGESFDLADPVNWTYSNGRTVGTVVPEPGTALLLVSGLTAALGRRFIRRARGRVI